MSVVADVFPPVVEVAPPPVPEVTLFRLSVEQYHEMVRQSILTEDDPVELLDGLLVTKMTKSTAHRVAKGLAQDALARSVPAGWYVDSQDAITLATSEPEPDVMVIRGKRRDHLPHHPVARELALVVEVSDSSLRHDRGTKKSLYAAAGIPVYWIINLIEQQVEVYSDPTGPAETPDYRGRQDFGGANRVPFIVGGREVASIPVSELLP